MADDEDGGVDVAKLEEARRSALQERKSRVEAALRAGKPSVAAKIALENPPFASKDASLKDANAVSLSGRFTNNKLSSRVHYRSVRIAFSGAICARHT
jgi:hypothetical protein